jgi:hypothetical protein
MHIIPASPNSHCSHNECLPASPKIPPRKKPPFGLGRPPTCRGRFMRDGFCDHCQAALRLSETARKP